MNPFTVKFTLEHEEPPPPVGDRPAWAADRALYPVGQWFDIPNSKMLNDKPGMGIDPAYLDRIYAGTTQGPVRRENVGSHMVTQPRNKYGVDNTIGYKVYNFFNTHATYNSWAHSIARSSIYQFDGDTHWPGTCVIAFNYVTCKWEVAINGTLAKDFKCGDFRVAPAYPRDFILSANIINKTEFALGDRVWMLTEDENKVFLGLTPPQHVKVVKVYNVIKIEGAAPKLAAVKPVYPGVINETVIDGDYTFQEEAKPMQRGETVPYGHRRSVLCTDGKIHSYIMPNQGGPAPDPEYVGTTAATAPVFSGGRQENVIDGTCSWQEGEYYGIPDVPPQPGESTNPYEHYTGEKMGGHGYSQMWVLDQNWGPLFRRVAEYYGITDALPQENTWRPLFMRVGPTTNRYPIDTGGELNGYATGWLDSKEWTREVKVQSWRGTVLGKRIWVGESTELRKCQHPLTGDIFEIFDRFLIRQRRIGEKETIRDTLIELQDVGGVKRGSLYNSVMAVDPKRNLLIGCSINQGKREWWSCPTDAPPITKVGDMGVERTMLTLTGPGAAQLMDTKLDRPRQTEGMIYGPDALVWNSINYGTYTGGDDFYLLTAVDAKTLNVTKHDAKGTKPPVLGAGSAAHTNKLKYDPTYGLLIFPTSDQQFAKGLFFR